MEGSGNKKLSPHFILLKNKKEAMIRSPMNGFLPTLKKKKEFFSKE